jgi:hypothetical protein
MPSLTPFTHGHPCILAVREYLHPSPDTAFPSRALKTSEAPPLLVMRTLLPGAAVPGSTSVPDSSVILSPVDRVNDPIPPAEAPIRSWSPLVSFGATCVPATTQLTSPTATPGGATGHAIAMDVDARSATLTPAKWIARTWYFRDAHAFVNQHKFHPFEGHLVLASVKLV